MSMYIYRISYNKFNFRSKYADSSTYTMLAVSYMCDMYPAKDLNICFIF